MRVDLLYRPLLFWKGKEKGEGEGERVVVGFEEGELNFGLNWFASE